MFLFKDGWSLTINSLSFSYSKTFLFSCIRILKLSKDTNGYKIVMIGDRTVLKDTVMQTEKALVNGRLRVFKVSWKFRIPIIHNFPVIYPWNLLFS